jgi:uncharacterized protein YbjT (DUF2867 family)
MKVLVAGASGFVGRRRVGLAELATTADDNTPPRLLPRHRHAFHGDV